MYLLRNCVRDRFYTTTMKTVLLSVALVLLVTVYGEDCNVASDCAITGCGSDGVLRCEAGKCTCVAVCTPDPSLAECKSQQHCLDAYRDHKISCACDPVSNLHCIDGECHCGYPPN